MYERLFGPGAVKDLFVHEEPPPAAIEDGSGAGENMPPPQRTDTVGLAQQLMHDNTHQLDTGEAYAKHEKDRRAMEGSEGSEGGSQDGSEKAEKKKKKSFFSRFLKK